MLHTLALVLALQVPQVPGRVADVRTLLAAVDAARLETTVRDLVRFGTRHTLSTTSDPKRGIGAARDYLEQRLRQAAARSNGRMKITREAHKAGMRGRRQVEVVNLVATIRGTEDPDRVYVVSGHYDSRNRAGRDGENDAPGANDDGSGTAAVVELAEVLAGTPLRATVRLVCYDGEEIGLMGSRADARTLKEKETNVDGMLTLDIVGNTEGGDGRRERGYVRVFSYQETGSDSTGRNLARVVSDAARRYVEGFQVKLIFRGDRYGRGGDHRPFHAAGWPAVRLTEPFENYSRQHQDVSERDGKPYGDLPDYMDFPYLANVTRVVLAAIYELASAPPTPISVRVRGTPELGTRAWIRPAAMPEWLAGFELVWRQTTAPDWQGSHFVPKQEPGRRGIETILPNILVDDVIIGARSVATDGSRSRAVSAREPGVGRRR